MNRVEHQKLNQTTAELSFGWVFGVQLGLRQTQALIKTKTIGRRRVPPATLLLSSKLLISSNVAPGTLLLPIVVVLISACVCRRPSWTPKTQPNDSSAVVWLSFWCSTWFTGKKVSLFQQSRAIFWKWLLTRGHLSTEKYLKRIVRHIPIFQEANFVMMMAYERNDKFNKIHLTLLKAKK